jgi:DNA-directed RNA polymerase subunit alpha
MQSSPSSAALAMYLAKLKKERVEIGEISVDAIFSPIRRVNYEVENMRVGDRTDFNRLRISIETDGTITPRAALEQSIEIMITQLKAIVGFREEEVEVAQGSNAADGAMTGPENSTEVLKTRIEDLELSSRTIASLEKANIRTVGGLARKREETYRDRGSWAKVDPGGQARTCKLRYHPKINFVL